MTTRASANGKLYLYGITPANPAATYGAIGLDDGAVYAVTTAHLSALVSRVPQRPRPERRHLAAHQEVLKQAGSATTVLPMTFGLVVEGPEAVRRILSENQHALLQRLTRVAGCVEMGLRFGWDVPNIFDYFVANSVELREARDHCFGRHREPTFDERIEVGRLFDRILAEEREARTASVEDVLGPHCVEIKRLKPRHEREIVNLACLVERPRGGEFETAVFEAAKGFDNNFAFDYSGPWAPHNFVELKLDLGAPE